MDYVMGDGRDIASCPNNTLVLFWNNGGPHVGQMIHDVLRDDGSHLDNFWGDGNFDDNNPPTVWWPLTITAPGA